MIEVKLQIFLFLWLREPYNLAENTVMISSTSLANSSSNVKVLVFKMIVSTPKCFAIFIIKSLPNRNNLSLLIYQPYYLESVESTDSILSF